MCTIEHVGRIRNNLNSTLAGEWGLSLHLESQAGGATGQYLLDFGYTPEILVRNFDLLGIEPERLNGLILSYGHRDHYGGLAGFVAHYRDRMRDDLRLFAGGKEAFREKWVGSRDEEPASWGALDRAALEAAKVETVYCECAHGLDGPFTTGNIARQSFERVLPNTLVEPTPADHFTEAERRGRLVPDRHPDEHATCYVVRGRGLVVISSCSHCGLINAIRQAMAVSGIDKLHAVLGGFHLGVAPLDYVEHTIGAKGPDTRCGDPDALHGPGIHRQNAHRNARAAGRLEYRKPLHLRHMNGVPYWEWLRGKLAASRRLEGSAGS